MTEEESKQQEEADMKIVQAAVSGLGEHFDTVQVFVSRFEHEDRGTMNVAYGAGNWYARYGQVVQWIERRNEDDRIERRKVSE